MKERDLQDTNLQPWWRYTWREDGSISNVERAEGGRQEDGRFVGYVQAPTKEAATIAAKRAIDRYARKLELALSRVKDRQARLHESGLCIRCGRNPAPEPPFKACAVCRARVADRAKTIRGGGERLNSPAAKSQAEKLEAAARLNEKARVRRIRADKVVKTNAYMRACVRLKLLKEALWHFDRKGPTDQFRTWLLAAIETERETIDLRQAAERGEIGTDNAAE